MRTIVLVPVCVFVLGLCAYLGSETKTDTVKVRIKLVDSATNKEVGGLVRVLPADKDKEKPLKLPGLTDRLNELKLTNAVPGWHVVPLKGGETTLPCAKLRLEGIFGLETALASQEIDLTGKVPAEIVVKLPFLFRPDKEGIVAGNTHLHLMRLKKDAADEYLRQIPMADGLKVMFISYLERNKDDEFYITNKYPVGDLKAFAGTGVLFNNGEEYRHNFTAYGQGYGHVMFLDMKAFIRPASLGPGITGKGDDDRALQGGIEEARKQGATIIWCHNTNGHEDVPNAVAGRLDALNVFDGSRGGTYEENYYRYLNIGVRLPISTGTDWFLYDFSRVYASVKGDLTIKSWLKGLKEGRCVATNSPLLHLSVDGKPLGTVLKIEKDTTVSVEAEGVGRHDFETLQLVQNGKVVQEAKPAKKDGGYTVKFVRKVRITEPAWFAVRITAKTTRNEMGAVLYAHSSPCYVDYQGKGTFDQTAALGLLTQLEVAIDDIKARGKFSSNEARKKVQAIYEVAARDLRERIKQRGKN